MATSLPYLASNKNVGELFSKIQSAAIPPKFTQEFLQKTIGLKGTNDRPLISMLRNLGFLDQSNTPTPSYSLLKSKDKSRVAIAEGVRAAYRSLFDADEKVFDLSGEKLKSLIAQVAGTDDDMTARIANTFAALAKQGDFNSAAPAKEENQEENEDDSSKSNKESSASKKLRADFQYVIQVQLPSNGTEEVYLNIFNAIRKTFQ